MDGANGQAVAKALAVFLIVGVVTALYVVGNAIASIVPALIAGLWVFQLSKVNDEPESFTLFAPPLSEYAGSRQKALVALEEVLSDSTYGVMDDTWEIEESKADRLVARLNFMDSSSHSGGRVERELLLRFDVIEPMPKLVRVQFEFRPYPLSVDYGSLADIIFELQEDLSESLGGQTGESFGRIRQVRILPPAWLMSSTVLLLILYCVEVVGIS